MTQIAEESLLTALAQIVDPLSGQTGAVPALIPPGGLRVRHGRVTVLIEGGPERESLRRQVEAVLSGLPGVVHVTAALTAPAAAPSAPLRQADDRLRPAPRIVAVASGKGGVGKSTLAANLALALARSGRSVGFLDADIYGPSAPILFGAQDYRLPVRADKKLAPLEKFGVRVMSIGFLVDQGAPVVWRGPMVQSGIVQMLRDTDWGALDVLIVDTPPGTGDAQMALAQKAALTGAVIVTTPQAIARADARKGLEALRKMGVPILGIVENMSGFACPCCGTLTPLFGSGGGRSEAQEAGVPFLGAIPLLADLCTASDTGLPLAIAQPQSPAAQAFAALADKLA